MTIRFGKVDNTGLVIEVEAGLKHEFVWWMLGFVNCGHKKTALRVVERLSIF